jgi:hypothetical protein
LLRAAVAGSERFRIDNSGLAYAHSFIAVTTTGIGWSPGFGIVSDLRLVRDNAYELALRFGSAAQTFRVYNTYTDASNYERGRLEWNTNTFRIGTGGQNAGTGSARSVQLDSGSNVFIAAGGTTAQWFFSTAGLLANADNTYDIGASGANRPRNVYLGSWMRMATTTVASLPAAATAAAGARMFVTDANATTFASIVAAGGANIVPVYSDGTNWRIG